jgi:hypothetical protein
MKKTILLLCASMVAVAALSNTASIFSWNETSFDFGNIPVGTPVSHAFEFTNTGTEPLIITAVQASCGCTVASYTQDPIAPGTKGRVVSTYNAAKAGVFQKTLAVQSNASNNPILTLKGSVVE